LKLYEINAALEALLEQVDEETGELTCDMEQLEALSLERDEKLEGLALSTKNDRAEAEAIYAEIDNLSKRARALKNRAERKSEFLERMLNGEKFQTPRVAITYRTSQAVELTPEFLEWAITQDKFLRYKDPEPDKTAIKAALKAGETVPGAEIVTRSNMSIK